MVHVIHNLQKGGMKHIIHSAGATNVYSRDLKLGNGTSMQQQKGKQTHSFDTQHHKNMSNIGQYNFVSLSRSTFVILMLISLEFYGVGVNIKLFAVNIMECSSTSYYKLHASARRLALSFELAFQ